MQFLHTRICRVTLRAKIGFVASLTAAALLTLAAEGKPLPLRAPNLLASGVIVLDNCDPIYKDKRIYEDNLSFLDASGKLQARTSGLNVCEEIGSPHRIAVDRDRKTVWVTESVGHRLMQYNLTGKEILAVPDIQASALAVDPIKGHVWVARSTGKLGEGSTEVFDQSGRVLAVHDLRAYDIAYDSKSKAFWLVERHLLKVSPDGILLVQKEITNWCAVSVAVNQKTGAVWVVTRMHSPGLGRNELLGFDNDGNLLHTIPLGDRVPFRVAVDDVDGSVWVTNMRRSILRFSAAGKLESEHHLPALTADVERSTGNVWVVTSEEVMKVNSKGEAIARTKHKTKTSQAWIASY